MKDNAGTVVLTPAVTVKLPDCISEGLQFLAPPEPGRNAIASTT
jgi:hypothetical protein